MMAFWPEVIRPLLEVIDPESIVEIGSESGKTTRLLAEFARDRGARVHAVDPKPLFDPAAMRHELGDHFFFHPLPSLLAISTIDRFDAVLIDGDHNWYTVFHELKLIEERSHEIAQPLPIIFLHDIAWPYGRRDVYYDPETIPAEHRQPFGRLGISPTHVALMPRGGMNSKMHNALIEGGPRNGVLTAIEDYLAQTAERFTFVNIPAVFGLGILLPEARMQAKPELRQRIEPWTVPEVARFIERLEMARIAMLVP